jgi:hypothetical protein
MYCVLTQNTHFGAKKAYPADRAGKNAVHQEPGDVEETKKLTLMMQKLTSI